MGASRSPIRTAAGSLVPASLLLSLLCILTLNVEVGLAQKQPTPEQLPQGPTAEQNQAEGAPSRFRVERSIVAEGGELLTIWARVVADPQSPTLALESPAATNPGFEEIPLVSVMRDTLGDDNRDNDVLGELWVHTYTKPKLIQQAAALVPFLYKGVRVEPRASVNSPPRPIINFSDTGQPVWQRLFVSGVANILIDQSLVKASFNNYRRNLADYRRSNLLRALTIISLYGDQPDSDSEFSEAELVQMQSQLGLTEKTLGGLVDKIHLRNFQEKEVAALSDTRGHNWELLRQRTEASGLYFEPLSITENNITHALLWFPADAALGEKSTSDSAFEGRFLNIKNPWRDKRLQKWRGYTETKYFDRENRIVLPTEIDEQAAERELRAVKMIPVGLYGLDFKKIPALLIDFRDPANPRRRELSGRLINDITRDVLSLSQFGNLYYFLARSAFNFATSRRGIDVNQPSRLRSAAELRLLLSLNENLSSGLREELTKGLDNLSVNPLEIGGKDERKVALAQYRALQAYALRPDGLPARLRRQRGSEAARLMHQGWDGKLMRLANILTLGRYTHREKITPELMLALDKKRQLDHHVGFLKEIARSTPVVEVAWSMEKVMPSLQYVAENGTDKDKGVAKTVGSIFSRTEDDQARKLCLSALKKIGNKEAVREMTRIYEDPKLTEEWRSTISEYLQIEQPQRSRVIGMSAGSRSSTSQLP